MNEIKAILDKVVYELADAAGIQAVVLGGSRARGTHSPESDIDIGIYYDKETLDLAALNKAAKPGYKDRVNSIFAAAGTDGANVCEQLRQLIDEVKGITSL